MGRGKVDSQPIVSHLWVQAWAMDLSRQRISARVERHAQSSHRYALVGLYCSPCFGRFQRSCYCWLWSSLLLRRFPPSLLVKMLWISPVLSRFHPVRWMAYTKTDAKWRLGGQAILLLLVNLGAQVRSQCFPVKAPVTYFSLKKLRTDAISKRA
jgi:hypothetical protein